MLIILLYIKRLYLLTIEFNKLYFIVNEMEFKAFIAKRKKKK